MTGFRRLFDRLKKETASVVSREAASFARGKVAGRTVIAPSGETIVEAGRTITEEVIAAAERTNCTSALATSAAAAKLQDLQESASRAIDATPDGQEARSLGSVEDAIEARRYVGFVTAMDVTDIRGAIVIPAGCTVDDTTIRTAREAGLLSALVFAAQQGGRARSTAPSTPPRKSPDAADRSEEPRPAARPSLPLVLPPTDPRPADGGSTPSPAPPREP